MLKLVLIALVVLGFMTAHGPTRSRIVTTAAPVLEKLGPVGQWMLRPMHRFTADTEVRFIADQLIYADEMGRDLPLDGTFQAWLKLKRWSGSGALLQLKAAGHDPWGSPYYLKRAQTSFTVGSYGPDREMGTADDIRATRSY